jgi:hypothetical protein
MAAPLNRSPDASTLQKISNNMTIDTEIVKQMLIVLAELCQLKIKPVIARAKPEAIQKRYHSLLLLL